MKKLYLSIAMLFFVSMLAPQGATAKPFDHIYVFGDSLSDNGNAYNLTFKDPNGGFPPLPYAQRFSNGPVAIETLASNFGVSLAPSTAGGTNYAVGGAATGDYTVSPGSLTTDNYIPYAYAAYNTLFNIDNLNGTGIDKQVGTFVTSSSFDSSRSLFFLWGGANDFFLAPEQKTVGTALQRIGNSITALAGSGAKYFFVPNLPDLSVTPYGLGLSLPDQAGLQQLSLAFNANLATILTSLAATLSIEIIQFDTLSVLNSMIANQQALGFSNVTDACVSSLQPLSVCPNPAEYLFWDSVHPTSRGHQILGTLFEDAVLAAIPEPQTNALMVVGLIMLLVLRQRRTLVAGLGLPFHGLRLTR